MAAANEARNQAEAQGLISHAEADALTRAQQAHAAAAEAARNAQKAQELARSAAATAAQNAGR